MMQNNLKSRLSCSILRIMKMFDVLNADFCFEKNNRLQSVYNTYYIARYELNA